jgi:SAM-dependent methyltransferase
MLAYSPDTRIDRGRWLEAQQYEQSFWQRLANDIQVGSREQLGWYQWRATRLEQRLATLVDRPPRDGKVLEIGSGPIGIVNFLEWGERYAIDPLEHFYRTQPQLAALRKSDVTYIDGVGERLPLDGRSLALVIIDNVIDHTYSPGAILQEIRRVLRPDGFLYLSVNVHTTWGAWLHALLAALRIDKGHPYTFTSGTLRRLLDTHDFTILSEQVDEYAEARRADRESTSLKQKVKGFTGLSEFSHSVVCRKEVARS